MEALADVLTFTTGHNTSLEKKSIGDYAGSTKVLTTNVGVIGWSAGGNLATLAMARHGEQFRDLAWYASWESPVLCTSDVGSGSIYQANRFYDPATGRVDYSRLGTVLTCRCGSGPLRDFDWTRVGHVAVCISTATMMALLIEMRTTDSGSDIGHWMRASRERLSTRKGSRAKLAIERSSGKLGRAYRNR